jgi:hypothetical protein
MSDLVEGLKKDSVEYLKSQGVPVIQPNKVRTFGMEVGDDRVTASSSTLDLALMHVVQEKVMKMETSYDDTFISCKYYNLAEVTSIIPRSSTGSFHHARKSGNEFSDLEFVDDSPLRVLMDVLKGSKEAHASTVTGKASFIRSRLKTRPEVLGKVNIANFYQDSLLNSSRASDPKYLPSAMAGTNVPPLFDEGENIYLYVHCFRGGTYERIYGSATNEAEDCIRMTDDSGIPQSLWLCQALRLKQLYLHATYDDKLAVPRREILASRLPEPLYPSLGPGCGSTAVEQRLMRAKVLLTQRDAEVELERMDKFELVLFGSIPKSYADKLSKIDSRNRSKAFGGALQANTAFMSLLNRKAVAEDMDHMLYKGFNVLHVGARRFTLLHSEFIARGCKGDVSSLEDLSQTYNMYLRDEISCEESLKVPGIPLLRQTGQGSNLSFTTTKVGLYNISQTQEAWASGLAEKLKDLREVEQGPISPELVRDLYFKNREWVSDDLLIISKVTDFAMKENLSYRDIVGIITTDVKECRRAANSANVTVAMIHPSTYYEAVRCNPKISPTGDYFRPNPVLKSIDKVQGKALAAVIIDTGSMCAHLSKLEEVKTKVYKRQKISTNIDGSDRWEKYFLIEDQRKWSYKIIEPSLNRNVRYRTSETSSYRKARSEDSASLLSFGDQHIAELHGAFNSDDSLYLNEPPPLVLSSEDEGSLNNLSDQFH